MVANRAGSVKLDCRTRNHKKLPAGLSIGGRSR
jgi:hypothetical protein